MCVLAHGEPVGDRDQAAHKCGRPKCVNPRHLRWATHRENMADKAIHGTETIDERNGKTTLTEEDVRAIRAAPPVLAPLLQKYGLSKHGRSEERRGGKECVRTCRSRWSPNHEKKKEN